MLFQDDYRGQAANSIFNIPPSVRPTPPGIAREERKRWLGGEDVAAFVMSIAYSFSNPPRNLWARHPGWDEPFNRCCI
jgi:hypothetical protein